MTTSSSTTRPTNARALPAPLRALLLLLVVLVGAGCTLGSQSSEGPRRLSEQLPNIELRTHNGEAVRFYDDLLKDQIVIVNFMYTRCSLFCIPTTSNLVIVHDLLGDRMGNNILMLSITLDPEVDTPEVLTEYAELYGGSREGWFYLTGDYEEIEALRHAMGVYDPDPIIDADKTQHAGLVTFGNDRTNRWAALPALMSAREMTEAILQITSG